MQFSESSISNSIHHRVLEGHGAALQKTGLALVLSTFIDLRWQCKALKRYIRAFQYSIRHKSYYDSLQKVILKLK